MCIRDSTNTDQHTHESAHLDPDGHADPHTDPDCNTAGIRKWLQPA